MLKLHDIAEAVSYLNEGDVITSNGKDQFVLKNEKICVYNEGTRFFLEPEDFVQLYKKSTFYLYEESAEIDETKDEAYYRYYRK
ncbi:MAG: hypothetical protein IJH00_00835 [Erysipelotrichaceae bacterium]|nr:hypothetical protein [Erysipelotrichaceae bacterium]MBQ6494111.1 hypothetical protein [Erysipelotrichaceae bacterium]